MEYNFWDDGEFNNPQNGEDLFMDLVQRALTEKNSQFEFIRHWQDRLAAKTYCFSIDTVLKIFRNLYSSTYKTYLTQVKVNEQDLQTILALKQFKQCINYYQKEKEIAEDMLEEYSEYVLSGHVIDTLVGKYRPDEDLWDHRRKDGK
jgi:hypothetical protein